MIEDKDEVSGPVEIDCYVGPLRLLAMGRRTMQFDVPEDNAVQFLAMMTLFGKRVRIIVRELGENE